MNRSGPSQSTSGQRGEPSWVVDFLLPILGRMTDRFEWMTWIFRAGKEPKKLSKIIVPPSSGRLCFLNKKKRHVLVSRHGTIRGVMSEKCMVWEFVLIN